MKVFYDLGIPFLLMAGISLAIAAQTSEPPVLPKGQYCAHVTRDNPKPAHPCACHRTCDPAKRPDEADHINEDAQCKQWCHADHCHCKITGCE